MTAKQFAEQKQIHEALVAAGCKTDHHASDLYVQHSPEAVELIKIARAAGHPVKAIMFRDAIDGESWIELPFCYSPFWNR